MADQKVTGLGVDPTKVNPYGASDEQLDNYTKTLKESIQALQQRYEQPNWFKVAAGFAKPQLGGFVASLGSASEALAENVEQQREQQLPISQMKAQLAQSEILMGQNKTASKMVADRRAKGLPITPEFVSEIVAIAPDSAVAKSLQAELSTGQKQQEITASVQQNALRAIEVAHTRGTTVDPEIYRQAGVKPPGMVSPTGGSDILPTDVTQSAITNPGGAALALPGTAGAPGGAAAAQAAAPAAPVIPGTGGAPAPVSPSSERAIFGELADKFKDNKDVNSLYGNYSFYANKLLTTDPSSKLYKNLAELVQEEALKLKQLGVPVPSTTEEMRGMRDAFVAGSKPPAAPAAQAAPAAAPERKERQYINPGRAGLFETNGQVVMNRINELYTAADAAKGRAEGDSGANKIATDRYASLEAAANPKTFTENQSAIDAMIDSIKSNPERADRVTNPLAQKGGLWGGFLSAIENGVGFNVQGLAGNINIPVSAAIIGSYDRKDREFYDTLNMQASRIAQIQQAQNNVNPSSIRNGEIELYKNASVSPKNQFPNAMLYNLQYSKLNNEMLHEMYNRANKIREDADPNYRLHPQTRTQMLDILTSPVMSEISEKYKLKKQKLTAQFLSSIK